MGIKFNSVVGFCQGCANFNVVLIEVAPDRYRCDACAGRERRGIATQWNEQKEDQ
jgi:hypothetical protein